MYHVFSFLSPLLSLSLPYFSPLSLSPSISPFFSLSPSISPFSPLPSYLSSPSFLLSHVLSISSLCLFLSILLSSVFICLYLSSSVFPISPHFSRPPIRNAFSMNKSNESRLLLAQLPPPSSMVTSSIKCKTIVSFSRHQPLSKP